MLELSDRWVRDPVAFWLLGGMVATGSFLLGMSERIRSTEPFGPAEAVICIAYVLTLIAFAVGDCPIHRDTVERARASLNSHLPDRHTSLWVILEILFAGIHLGLLLWLSNASTQSSTQFAKGIVWLIGVNVVWLAAKCMMHLHAMPRQSDASALNAWKSRFFTMLTWIAINGAFLVVCFSACDIGHNHGAADRSNIVALAALVRSLLDLVLCGSHYCATVLKLKK